jgi:dihydrofolate synthase/folylpolyglutamate synthase
MMSEASRVDAILGRLEHFGVKLGLERMRSVLAALGGLGSDLPVVLVAGTNGKGSTAAMIASMLTAAGYRSGLFTSPHLEVVEERIRVDGRAISTGDLAESLERVVSAAEGEAGNPVTYFEALAAASLDHFREAGVDVAVLEVGLGGRLDATNATEPVLSVITGIAYDHQQQLGDTLAEIAIEKAGILRHGRPAVTLQRSPEAASALVDFAGELGAELIEVQERVEMTERRELGAAGQSLRLETPAGSYQIRLRLPGEHQTDNLALAVAAAEKLADLGWARLDRTAIEAGVAACRWPARLEWVDLPGRVALLDAAHNPAGVASLDRYLEALGRRFTLVFGMLRSKVDPEVSGRLWRRAEHVVLTRPPSDRALPPRDLAEMVGAVECEIVESPGEALDRALATEPDLLVVSGSIYLVGEIRGALRSRFGLPPGTRQLFGV